MLARTKQVYVASAIVIGLLLVTTWAARGRGPAVTVSLVGPAGIYDDDGREMLAVRVFFKPVGVRNMPSNGVFLKDIVVWPHEGKTNEQGQVRTHPYYILQGGQHVEILLVPKSSKSLHISFQYAACRFSWKDETMWALGRLPRRLMLKLWPKGWMPVGADPAARWNKKSIEFALPP